MSILSYAVRVPIILKYFGQLCIALALLTMVPLLVSVFFGDFEVSKRYAAIVGATLCGGILCSRIKTKAKMQNNEAMVITALIFLFSPLMMTWPVMASGLGFTDAFFETVSAVTTTGLSISGTMAGKSQTFLFSRAWMQWIGGLGIVVLCMAALIQPGLTAKRLDISESFEKDIAGGTRAMAQRILIVYVVITLLGIAILVACGVGWFSAILYAISAISTGGFAPYDGSLAALPNLYAETAVIVISMLGAVSLLVYYRIFSGNENSSIADQQLKTFLLAAILVVFILALLLWLKEEYSFEHALKHGMLNGLSALSTAGFSSLNISEIGDDAKGFLIAVMAVGGSTGSTAGGIKIIRLLILLRLLHLILLRAAAPVDAIVETRLGTRKLEINEILNAVCIFILFVCITMLSWFAFLHLDYDPLDSLFDIVSALATVGLSAGITSPELHPILKVILCVNMLLGRLEIVAWLVFLYPGTWFGTRKEK